MASNNSLIKTAFSFQYPIWLTMCIRFHYIVLQYVDGLVQERRHSIANALESRLSCTKPLIKVVC